MRAFNPRSAYHWYLRTTFWQERRQHVFKRNNYVCERCNQRRATDIHHKTYARVFNEHLTDLMALCRQCHATIHHKQPANDNQSGPIQLSFKFEED